MTSFQPEELIQYSSIVNSYALPQNVYVKYKTDWNTFERIQAFDSNVSTVRATSTTNLSYYTFVDYVEKNSFKNGQYLHVLYLPNSNWNVVQKN
jgi:hypothetical protein